MEDKYTDANGVVWDIVHGGNESLYRHAFAVANGHSDECVGETVYLMSHMMAMICNEAQAPLDKVLGNMEVEEFDVYLRNILKTKKCSCNES